MTLLPILLYNAVYALLLHGFTLVNVHADERLAKEEANSKQGDAQRNNYDEDDSRFKHSFYFCAKI